MPTREELVADYGSPLFVYDLDRVRIAARDLRAALPEPCTLYYSLKANPHARLAGELRELCRAEVYSAGELSCALDAGFPAGEILYGGPGKTAAEIDFAVRSGVREFSAESLADLRRIGDAAAANGVTARCLLRINDTDASATTSIRMTGTPSQFGVDRETLPHALRKLRSVPAVDLVGLHFFPLSNARDEESLIAEFAHSIETAARLRDEFGIPLSALDIGGGFAAPYAVPGERPRYHKLRSELASALDTHLPNWRAGSPAVAYESGRYLAGDSGQLLCTVTNLKISRGRTFVILDAGINVLGGMAGLGRLMPLAISIDTPARRRKRQRVNLAGPLCTPADLLGRNVPAPRLDIGDVVAIPNAGAYGLTASLVGFLSRPVPAEVFLSGGDVVSVSRLELRRVGHAP